MSCFLNAFLYKLNIYNVLMAKKLFLAFSIVGTQLLQRTLYEPTSLEYFLVEMPSRAKVLREKKFLVIKLSDQMS